MTHTPEQLEALAANRKGTQFGQPGGNKTNYENRQANKPWSIRNQCRRLAAQEVDENDKNAVQKLLPKNPTLAQLIAVNTLVKATKGDMRAVEWATENVDGKLPQTNLNADFERLKGMSEEELDAELARANERLAALEALDREDEDFCEGTQDGAQAEDAPLPDTGAALPVQ
jgi:hypothetical protein